MTETAPRISKIVFVWNADFSVAGAVNAVREVVGGVHTCSLCEIAYHRVRQTKDWKAYKSTLAKTYGDVREPCRNQLTEPQVEAADGDYPAVLAHVGGRIVKLLGGADIDACDGDFHAFRTKLEAALQTVAGD